MMRRITPFMAGTILFGLCLAACNRPVLVTKRSSAMPVPPTLAELSMTRTAIAGPIIATLTAVGSTSAPQVLQTTAAPTVETPATPTTPVTPVVTTQVVTVAPVTQVVKTTVTQKPVVVQQPVPALPQIYWLQRGEFPFCIARRFNIDPGQLMWVNGFCPGQIFYAGQGIIIPNNPLPYRGRRAFHIHPATYQVRPGDTIFKIACFFGDVDPLYLAQVNELAAPFRLRVGQILNIP
jgi:LysM repeat protein